MDKPKAILVAEDEKDLLNVICMRLKGAGYETVTASNGKEALDAVKAHCPDLIITDVLMPVMDGYAFYKELKKNKATADIPVIILTARGRMEDSFKVMGVDSFMAKPFKSEVLLAKIKELTETGPHIQQAEKKILVVGTEKNIVENMALLLKKIGCQVEIARSQSETITKVVQSSPDIVVVETQLGEKSSAETIKIIKSLAQMENKPIVAYSYFSTENLGSVSVRQKALSADSALDECKEAGIKEYIGRFNEQTFIELIAKYLKSHG